MPRRDCFDGFSPLQEFDFKVIGYLQGAENTSQRIICQIGSNPYENDNDRECVHGNEALEILSACHNGPTGDINGANPHSQKKIFGLRCSSGPPSIKIYPRAIANFMGTVPVFTMGTSISSWQFGYLSNGLKRKRLPTNDARVVCKFLENISSPDFGAPVAIICRNCEDLILVSFIKSFTSSASLWNPIS
ncbi:hypothetical protein Tco_0449613 [Tanacetum coccineum]